MRRVPSGLVPTSVSFTEEMNDLSLPESFISILLPNQLLPLGREPYEGGKDIRKTKIPVA
ncbi:hypothetical protein STA3757_46460 [Stanieria sp. NIES-3757]|nr:hypothetical protein STA3757_46460 [Stanieria sp. NIES-3757]